jgi:outer membrane protein OmpA-like peptidoglycan-associated protein
MTMSVNLLNLATTALGSDFGQLAGKFLGEDGSATQKGLTAILPAIFGGMVQKGSTLDGATGLMSVLNGSGVDSNLLNNVASLFGNNGAQASTLLSPGASLLGGLFGDKVGGIASAIASISGLKSSSAVNLLGLVAPLVFGFLRKHTSANSINASGLMDLLKGQTSHINSAIDPSIAKVLGVTTQVADSSRLGAAATAAAAGSTASAVAAKSGFSLGKLVPWLIAGAAALWLLSNMKSCGSEKTIAPVAAPVAPAAPAPSVVAAPTPAPTAAAAAKPETAKLYFATAKYDPPVDAAKTLDKLVDYARSSPNTKLGISGFHDKRGDPAANAELSKQRALAVKNVLISAGVTEDRLILNKPTELTDTKDDQEARRVDVFVAQ